MSGVISFTSGEPWFINGWGWRQLMQRAIRDAGEQPYAGYLIQSLHLHGVTFELIEPAERPPIAAALLRAAKAVAEDYADHPDAYEQGYVTHLRDLAQRLREA
jgi:hypothetical protein